ncbi:hypothetical protein OROGR_009642 [Orobanche gracilis]
MERSEPILVPEWLKNAGNSTGGGFISHTDDHAASRIARNKSFVNSNGHNSGRSSSSERTTSSYFRRSSSSNSSGNVRTYSSFGRNQWDRDWEKDTYNYRDQDKSAKGDCRHRDLSDPPMKTPISKFDRDELRRSQNMVSGKHGDTWPKKVVTESSGTSGKNTNGVHTRGTPVGAVTKAAFERDFPSLGGEERAVTPEVGRVPSPGLNTGIRSLPGTSALIGGEKWTSALAEVPMLVGSNGTVSPSVQQGASFSRVSNSTISLNMAEAVAQGPNCAQTTPQLSVGTQRIEELVIKQSRQLIPMTPSMPKTLDVSKASSTVGKLHVLKPARDKNGVTPVVKDNSSPTIGFNFSDKQKCKLGQQQQHSISSSHPVNHSPRGGSVKDVSKASATVGKLHVLKPARDKNGVNPVVKDNSSPTSSTQSVISTLLSTASGPASTRGPPDNAVSERKPVSTVLEKRPTSQARSRNDFFNLMRKKSMENPSPVAEVDALPDKHAVVEALPADDTFQAVEAPLSLSLSSICEEKAETYNADAKKHVSNGKKYPRCDPIISEEEEAAFLRSMGWEENDEEGGLTDEEISSFCRDLTKHINSKPSLKILQGLQLKFTLPLDSRIKCTTDGIPDAKLES